MRSSRGTRPGSWGAAVAVAVALVMLLAVASAPAGAIRGQARTPDRASPGGSTSCGPDLSTITGTATPDQAKTYELFAFEVPSGTTRIEVGYTWDPLDQGVIDLGVWDQDGTRGPNAFRAWAGSRQGRIDKDTAPLVIEAGNNSRTVVDGTVDPGTWNIELGYAAVDQPLGWRVELRCIAGTTTAPPADDPVDPTTVERQEAGWYAGDFHLHSYHSSPDGPTADESVAAAKVAGLDIIPITEYVTPAHWQTLGATQRANPDVLIWPGREVITYFGHFIVLSETPSVIEHRVGYQGITIDDILAPAAGDGALVSVAHPTIFPPETFGSACRGCFNQLIDQIDFSNVELMEVVTEGSIIHEGDAVGANPFVRTAVELWESELRKGNRLTAVSGSDSKQGDGYGSTNTEVYADQLSRPAVDEALRRGHAYVRGIGQDSPTMDLIATTPDGSTAMMGDTLVTETADLRVAVHGGEGQQIAIRRNGSEVERAPITTPDFTYTTTLSRSPDDGPLGTFWGVEVIDTTSFPGTDVPTVIANPVFLNDVAAPEPVIPDFGWPVDEAATGSPPAEDESGSSPLGWIVLGLAAAAVLAGGVTLAIRRNRETPAD